MLMDTTNASSAEKERSNNAGTIQTVYLAANGQKNDINQVTVHLSPLHAFSNISYKDRDFSDIEKI